MAQNNWIYIGIFLNKESSVKLMTALHDYIPNGWNVYCHHMTIAFNNHSEIVQKFYNKYSPRFGEKCKLKVVGIGISDKAIAVKVETACKTNNAIPHITVAVSNTGKPIDSNYIQKWYPVEDGMILSGEINEFVKLSLAKKP